MRHQIRTGIDIDASPAEVWRTLVDVGAYHEWNPFITSGAGTVAVGEQLTLRFEPPGGRAMTIRPQVTTVEHGRLLEWVGNLWIPGLFEGRHRFELSPSPAGTTLVHSERFRGVLVRPMRRSLDGHTRMGFEALNSALAARVAERRAN
jgi:hypothetical protein